MLTSYEIYSMCKSGTGLQNGKNKMWRKKKHKIWNKFILWCLTMSVNDKINILSPFFFIIQVIPKKEYRKRVMIYFTCIWSSSSTKKQIWRQGFKFHLTFSSIKINNEWNIEFKESPKLNFYLDKNEKPKKYCTKMAQPFHFKHYFMCSLAWVIICGAFSSPGESLSIFLVVLFWMIRAQI